MAGVFAPTFEGEVAYERPMDAVEQPSMTSALAGLGKFFVDDYGSKLAADAARSASADPNLDVFRQGLERVEAIRDEKGDAAARIAENQLASNFANNDVNFGAKYKDVYEKTTGRPWAGYGRDNEAFMLEQAMQDPQVQASYVASYATLPDEATEEERIEYAIGQKATLQASADIIARAKAEGGYKWEVETEAAYGRAIDTFLGTNFGSLVATNKQGGRVGPQALANLQASWSQFKVEVSRPKGVTEEQWKSTQSKITNIDTMLTNLQKAASSDVLFEDITTAMASALMEAGDGSTQSVLAAMTAIKDPSTLATLSGADVNTFIMDVGKGINLEVTQPDLFGHIAEQTGLGNTPSGDITIESLPPSVQSKVEGLSPEQYLDGLKASGQLTRLTDANSLQRPEGRQQFVENTAGIGAVLMSMENDDFLSATFLKELVGNPQFVQNIKTLDTVDPEGATVARTYLRSGLNTELVRQNRNLAAIEATTVASWNGTNYVIDNNALAEKIGGGRVEQFTRSLQKNYNGDIATAVRDGFRRVIGDGLTDIVQIAGLYNLEGAVERRDAISVINNTLNAFSLGTPEGETALTSDQLTGQDTTSLIATAQSVLGLDENKQTDILSNFLSAGGIEIDPSQTAWCAAFVNATLSKTGLNGTGALNARSFLNWGTEVTQPQLGDVVVLSRGDNPAQGHVGFFKGFDGDGNILLLGGNQGDAVSVQSYDKSRLLGYRRPDGVSGIGTEAGLSEAVYKAGTDPSFLPSPVPEQGGEQPSPLAVTESIRPQARPVEAAEEVVVDEPIRNRRTERGEAQVGDQGLVRVVNSPVFDRDMQRFLQMLKVNMDQAFSVNDLDELETAQAEGKLKKGDQVVVGKGAEAFVVEIE